MRHVTCVLQRDAVLAGGHEQELEQEATYTSISKPTTFVGALAHSFCSNQTGFLQPKRKVKEETPKITTRKVRHGVFMDFRDGTVLLLE